MTLGGKSERTPPDGFEYVALDRDEQGALAVANGFDLVVDVIPFYAIHAKQLLELDAGALVAISSASVSTYWSAASRCRPPKGCRATGTRTTSPCGSVATRCSPGW